MSEKSIILPPEDGAASDDEGLDPTVVEKLDVALNGFAGVLPMQVEQCANCRFWMNSPSIAQKDKQGLCRRHPPTVFILGFKQVPGHIEPQAVTQSYFPSMGADRWCGEFQRKLVQ